MTEPRQIIASSYNFTQLAHEAGYNNLDELDNHGLLQVNNQNIDFDLTKAGKHDGKLWDQSGKNLTSLDPDYMRAGEKQVYRFVAKEDYEAALAKANGGPIDVNSLQWQEVVVIIRPKAGPAAASPTATNPATPVASVTSSEPVADTAKVEERPVEEPVVEEPGAQEKPAKQQPTGELMKGTFHAPLRDPDDIGPLRPRVDTEPVASPLLAAYSTSSANVDPTEQLVKWELISFAEGTTQRQLIEDLALNDRDLNDFYSFNAKLRRVEPDAVILSAYVPMSSEPSEASGLPSNLASNSSDDALTRG